MDIDNHYSILDKLLHQLSFSTVPIQLELDNFEEKFFRKVFDRNEVVRPIFITALPRAGTTLLLELCANLDEFATHTYRDMPFVMLPMMWNKFSERYRQNNTPRERAHGDGMLIDFDSPEAFEEIIWKAIWRDQYLPNRIEPWSKQENLEFRKYFRNHLKKIISVRQKNEDVFTRYVSKNNSNIARIQWILKTFPDALFVIPTREPLQHAASLLRQHKHFLKIHADDPFSRKYMAGIGHYDFGDNLRPINFNGWLDTAASNDATKLSFWIEYWVEAYSHLNKQRGEQVKLLSYEELCNKPKQIMERLADFLGIEEKDKLLKQSLRIKLAKPHPIDTRGVDPKLINRASTLYKEMKAVSLN